jgi:hypothetical protein
MHPASSRSKIPPEGAGVVPAQRGSIPAGLGLSDTIVCAGWRFHNAAITGTPGPYPNVMYVRVVLILELADSQEELFQNWREDFGAYSMSLAGEGSKLRLGNSFADRSSRITHGFCSGSPVHDKSRDGNAR